MGSEKTLTAAGSEETRCGSATLAEGAVTTEVGKGEEEEKRMKKKYFIVMLSILILMGCSNQTNNGNSAKTLFPDWMFVSNTSIAIYEQQFGDYQKTDIGITSFKDVALVNDIKGTLSVYYFFDDGYTTIWDWTADDLEKDDIDNIVSILKDSYTEYADLSNTDYAKHEKHDLFLIFKAKPYEENDVMNMYKDIFESSIKGEYHSIKLWVRGNTISIQTDINGGTYSSKDTIMKMHFD